MRGMKMRHQMTGVKNARKAAMERLHDLANSFIEHTKMYVKFHEKTAE